jgi:hypothetical protein
MPAPRSAIKGALGRGIGSGYIPARRFDPYPVTVIDGAELLLKVKNPAHPAYSRVRDLTSVAPIAQVRAARL